MNEKQNSRGLGPQRPLRDFSEPKEFDPREYYRGRLQYFIYAVYPFLVLLILASGIFLASKKLFKDNKPASFSEARKPQIDLTQAGAFDLIVESYVSANGGIEALEKLIKSEQIQFHGMIKDREQLLAFKGKLEALNHLDISFVDTAINLDLYIKDGMIERDPTNANYLMNPAIASLTCAVSNLINPLSAIARGDGGEIIGVERVYGAGIRTLIIQIAGPRAGLRREVHLNEDSMCISRISEAIQTNRSREFRYSNFKKVNNVTMPFSVDIYFNDVPLPQIQFLHIVSNTPQLDPHLIFSSDTILEQSIALENMSGIESL